MEQNDIDLATFKARTNEINAIIDGRTTGNGGTLCRTGSLRDSIYDYHGKGRFKWLKQFIHKLRYGCD